MYLSVLQLFPKSIKETNNGGKLLSVIVTIIVIWAVFINLLASLYTGWKDSPQWINSRNPLENQPESTISTIIDSSFLKCITLFWCLNHVFSHILGSFPQPDAPLLCPLFGDGGRRGQQPGEVGWRKSATGGGGHWCLGHETRWCHSCGKSPFLIGKPSISMGHGFHGYVSHNQSIINTLLINIGYPLVI